MPYVVTTKRAHELTIAEVQAAQFGGLQEPVLSRRAVAALDDLDPYVRDEFLAGRSVIEERNSGTVIEVEPVEWVVLGTAHWNPDATEDEILYAFNTRESKR